MRHYSVKALSPANIAALLRRQREFYRESGRLFLRVLYIGCFLKTRAYKELREQSIPGDLRTRWHSGPCCEFRQTQVVKQSSDEDVTGPSRLPVLVPPQTARNATSIRCFVLFFTSIAMSPSVRVGSLGCPPTVQDCVVNRSGPPIQRMRSALRTLRLVSRAPKLVRASLR